MIYTLTLNPALDRELTVPALVFDEVLRALEVRVDFGGKGLNVSRALAALGEKSVALGFVGGRTGEALRDGLEALGIGTDFVRIAGETRTNVSMISENHAHYIKVNEPGPSVTDDDVASLLNKVKGLARPGDWWVLSGSLVPGVPAGLYADIIRLVQKVGARAVLDTSAEALRLGCEAGPFLAKPNATEAEALTGLPVNSARTARMASAIIYRMGVQNVVISLGRRGALLLGGDSAWVAEPPFIKENNPVGAGDALVAGIIQGLERGKDLPGALHWGAACGAAAASLPGTAVGGVEMVTALAGEVKVSEYRS